MQLVRTPGLRREVPTLTSVNGTRLSAAVAEILIVSLGSTSGLRAADDELAGALRARRGATSPSSRRSAPRAGAHARADRPRLGARGARARRSAGIAEHHPRAVVYATVTAALLWPRPGAIRYDAPAAANRPGRHGVWQRPLERRRLREAPLLVPRRRGRWPNRPRRTRPPSSSRSRSSRRGPRRRSATSPPSPTRPTRRRRGWTASSPRGRPRGATARSSSSRGPSACPAREGVRAAGPLAPEAYRALLRRARVFVTAPAPRGLRRRPARGARRRLPARHDRGARPVRGAAAGPRARPAARRRRPRRRAARRARRPRAPATPSARSRRSRLTAAPPSTPSSATSSSRACSPLPAPDQRVSARACAAPRTAPTGSVFATSSLRQPGAARRRDAPARVDHRVRRRGRRSR